MRTERIKLNDVYPDPNNPRQISEDDPYIDELAESFVDDQGNQIGEPDTSIVVAQDGGIYQIIDGECRYLAMRKLGTKECWANIVDTNDEKLAVLSMLKTDIKRPLTSEEKARGMQLSMLTGVSPIATGKTVRIDPALLEKYRDKVMPKVKDDSAFQPDFDDMRMLAEFADDEEATERLLNAKHLKWEYASIKSAKDTRERARKSAIEIEESGAKLYTMKDAYAIPFQKRTYYLDKYNRRPIKKKGCGCDGFSACIDASGRAEYFCTKPENHDVEQLTPAEIERLRLEDLHKSDRARRDDYVVQLLMVDDPPVGILALMDAFVRGRFVSDLNEFQEDTEQTIVADTIHILIAAAVRDAESCQVRTIMDDSGLHLDGNRRRYLALLTTLETVGYELSDNERAEVNNLRLILDSREESEDDEA